MTEQLKVWPLFGKELKEAALNANLPAPPLLGFANDANEVFRGFRTLAEILQAGDVPEIDDEGSEGRTPINGYQRDALLGLIRVTSNVMVARAEHVEELTKALLKRGADHE